jgi:sugar lactone lactonase YvrE
LLAPQGVIVNHLGQIYVADWDNHRVMRWCKGAKEGTIFVGGNGVGRHSTQFYHPSGLSFDRQGNLYVADCENNRLQKFEIN